LSANPKTAITPARSAIASADQNPFATALAGYDQSRYNFATPITVLDRVPPMHRVSVRVVQIDVEAETYPVGKDAKGVDKVGLGKTALDKIAAAAGISWLPERCGQIDQYKHPHRVKYRAVGTIRDFDGRSRVISGEREIDLRGEPDWPIEDIGSDAREFVRQAGSKTPFRMEVPAGTKSSTCRDCDAQAFWVKTERGKNMLLNPDGTSHFDSCAGREKLPGGWDRVYQQRANIHSLAESKAKLRAIRSAIGIPSAMTPERAALPFVVPTLVPDLDVSDPEVRRMLAASLIGSQEALYGPRVLPAGAQAPALDEPESAPAPESDVIDVSASIDADDEPDFPPEDEPASACGLPVTEETINAVPVHDEQRMRYLSSLAAWCKSADTKLGSDRAGELFQKLGAGFEPLAASLPEISAMVAAIKQEIGAGK